MQLICPAKAPVMTPTQCGTYPIISHSQPKNPQLETRRAVPISAASLNAEISGLIERCGMRSPRLIQSSFGTSTQRRSDHDFKPSSASCTPFAP
jgi:hypothetical protein